VSRSSFDRAATLAIVTLAVAAVVKELRKPPAERTWHGKVAGVVPYDFRRPTVARLRERCWNPHDRRFLTPQVFGIGWTFNLARLRDVVSR
jgi:hypothetical protein